MDALNNLRQTAARRHDEIEQKYHRNLKLTLADQAVETRDAFQSLGLDKIDDPQAQALSKAMAPLAAWAGNDASRVLDAYGTALHVAGQVLGGPLGAGLSACKDKFAPIAVSNLAQKAGNASRQFLDAVVPDAWTKAGSPQWELGQQTNLVREGRGDLASQVGWVRGHMQGREVHASDIEGTLQQRKDFTARYESAGWRDVQGYGPWELEGREVAMLYPTPGALVEVRGVVEGSRRGMSAFRISTADGVTFNSNNVSAMVMNAGLR